MEISAPSLFLLENFLIRFLAARGHEVVHCTTQPQPPSTTKNGDIEWKTLKFSVVVSLNACTYRVQWNGYEIVASLGAVFYLSHAVGCYSDIFPCIGA